LLLLPGWAGCAQDAGAFYKRNCAACHSIGGGRLLGPDLKDVERRKDRKWLTQFLRNPKETLEEGDPYGKQIQADAKGMVMPQVPGIDEAMAAALLDYIAAGGAQPAAAAGAPEAAFSPADASLGEALAVGKQRLANGGPPCASCHAFAGLEGPAGGGKLGPDLTNEFEKLGGRQGLAAWLGTPPTPTMQAIYATHPLKAQEITAITAWLQSQPRDKPVTQGRSWIALLGPGGCIAGLLLMNALWSKRFRSVRATLAGRNSARGRSK
jgi:mono/diheme cytochrome c family protein